MIELLQTDRLRLRRFREVDAPLLFELDRDPEVVRYTGPGHQTVEEYREKIVSQFLPAYAAHSCRGVFAVEEKDSGDFVGWFILRPSVTYRYAAAVGWFDASEIEIGYRFHKRFWGRGLATEGAIALRDLAFDDAETTAIVACALTANRASTRVMEKLGMTPRYNCELPDGFGTAVIYGMTRVK